MAELTIHISDYLSEEQIRNIAEEELRYAFRRQFQTEADVERVLTNLSHEYILALLAEQWDGDFTQMLRVQIENAIKSDMIKYTIFRRKDVWDRTESPAVKILDEECANSRPLIKAAVEEHIKNYDFRELEEDEIADTVYSCIMDRLFGRRSENV